jgi:5-methylcytosine-specific restriction endonuclease McrA
VAAHEELTLLARRRAELDGLEGPALLRAFRVGVHRHLGFGSFAEYVERLFGYSRRTLDDKLRTAEALEELPTLARSLHEGTLSWSAVRELARVATVETELEWLDAARGRSVHEVERLVSGRRRGARPGDEPDTGQERRILRFDVSAETFATFREATRALRQRSNAPLDDDSALLLMAREILGGSADAGKSSYQIAMNVCERCGHAATHVGPKHRGDDWSAFARDVSTETATDTSEPVRGIRVGRHDVPGETDADRPFRATQSIPPALRRKVMRRDHGRCVVPGCRHATFVDLHHIRTRADGGKHDEDNLVVLCSAHHRALHRGQLEIVGCVRQGLVFRRADGAAYGALGAPRRVDAGERAFRGLRGLGFGEREARRAVERVRSAGDTATLLRRALSLLTEPSQFTFRHRE